MPLDPRDTLDTILAGKLGTNVSAGLGEAIDALIKERIAQAAWGIVQSVDRLKAQGYTPEYGFEPIRVELEKAWGDAT